MTFSPRDLDECRAHGIAPEDAARQIDLLRNLPPSPVLDRPCGLDDGIRRLDPREVSDALRLFDAARGEGRISKFIPASGGATRMFKALAAYRARHTEVLRDRLEAEAEAGDPDAGEVLKFALGLPRFPFFEDLRALLQEKGHNPSASLTPGDYTLWIDLLLTPDGLSLAGRPKALVPFHRLRGQVRTPLEEHLIESIGVLRDGQGICRFHFTVSPEHEPAFRARLAEMLSRLGTRYGCRWDVSFSLQSSSTDTVALDAEGRPARRKDGALLFRPGGHGALLGNLNDHRGDVVLVKNIDNVAHELHPGESARWDAVLAGLLVDLQTNIFKRLSWLSERPADVRLIGEVESYAADQLNILPPDGAVGRPLQERRSWLMERLDRPLRVCAVVKNLGESGGGPFWVKSPSGESVPQIIESAQVSDDLGQQKVFQSASFFNPVHMALGVRNSRGESFDLTRFADADAVFSAEKTFEGATLRVLERPGLWNGGMARWTTVFVEAPLTIFHPVKSVVDLLRSDHQPV